MQDIANEESLWETRNPTLKTCCICEGALGEKRWEVRPTGLRKNKWQWWVYCAKCWDLTHPGEGYKEFILTVEALHKKPLDEDDEYHVWLPDESILDN